MADDDLKDTCLHCLLLELGHRWLDANAPGDTRTAVRMLCSYQAARAVVFAGFPDEVRAHLMPQVLADLRRQIEAIAADEATDLHGMPPAGSA